MTSPAPSHRPGLEARRRARARPAAVLHSLARKLIATDAPWLLTPRQQVPPSTDWATTLSRKFAALARTTEEQALLDRILWDLLDGWISLHPDADFSMPPPVVMIPAPVPFWTPERIEDLRRARALHQAFVSRSEALTEENLRVPVGLVLLSAIFDSACLSADHLAEFCRWIAAEGEIGHFEGLPPWIDLKERDRLGAARRSTRRLRIASGQDETGAFALRRLFLSARTLDLVGRIRLDTDQACRIDTILADPAAMLRDILAPLDGITEPPRTLRALLSGAMAMAAVDTDPPDHATLMLAA